MRFKDYFNTLWLEKDDDASSFYLYHGGSMNQSDYTPKKGRWEYGPGLYLTNSYALAARYGRGSRKVFKCKIKKGNEISQCYIPTEEVSKFINIYGGSSKKNYQSFLSIHNKDGRFPAKVLVNLAVNNNLRSSSAKALREFLVEHEVDYSIERWIGGEQGTYILTLYDDANLLEFKPVKSSSITNSEYLIDMPHELINT